MRNDGWGGGGQSQSVGWQSCSNIDRCTTREGRICIQMSEVTYEGRDLEVLADMPNYHAWIMSWFGQYVHGRVVEYGAGTGTISQYLRPVAQRLTLIEPSANLHAALRARFPDDALVEIEALTLEEHVKQTETGTVDTAVLVNVLEHIEDDANALAELSRIVVPGGHVLIFVPALSLLMSRLDGMLGHFRRYHSVELRDKLRAAGLQVVRCRYFDFPGILPWLLVNRLLGSTSFSPALVKLYDRAAVPMARRIERLIPPPLGKNLVAIARVDGDTSGLR
jgi:SAM-dependent methyltransferase